MSPRSFAVLLLATVACVGLGAYALIDRDVPVTAAQVDEPLAPTLAQALDSVAKVTVQTGGQTMTVSRSEQGWRLEEKGGYPVQPGKVRDLVLAIANARLVEAKTDDPERLDRLELDDPAAEESRSKLVRIENAEGEPIAAVVVGKTKYGLYGAGRGGAYVRKADQDQAWLADRQIEVPTEAIDWFDTKISALPAGEVAEVTLQAQSAEPTRLVRAAGNADGLTLAAVPEGREADPEKIGRVTGLLESLTMQDVRPAAEVDFGTDPRKARFVTADGVVLEATMAEKPKPDKADEKVFWVRFDVSRGEPPAVRASSSGPAPEAQAAAATEQEAATAEAEPVEPEGDKATAEAGPEAADAKADAAPPPSPEEQVAKLEAALEGWAFEVPQWQAQRLTWTADDLLKPADKTS
jgi:hypothetical protein